jgi:hypothetical protein
MDKKKGRRMMMRSVIVSYRIQRKGLVVFESREREGETFVFL